MREQMHRLAEGAPHASFENRHRHGDGSYRWLSWRAAPFREEGLVYVFVRDITFRKVAEEERLQLVREQEARRAAERENEIKDHFLATLSHELRSPLTPILGWTTLLRSGHLGPEETPRALEVIERNARLQAQLIDDLLDVSRIVSGKLRMDQRPIDLRAVVEAGLEAVQTAAGQRGVALSVRLGADPLVVVGDQERLQQVVWNLAMNAVKFSRQGRRRARERRGRPRRGAACACCDDGVGISAEFLPHVFDRFQQATSGSTRTHGGLGLGLTIVRHIVEAHGGRVAAESEGLESRGVLQRAAAARERRGRDGAAERGCSGRRGRRALRAGRPHDPRGGRRGGRPRGASRRAGGARRARRDRGLGRGGPWLLRGAPARRGAERHRHARAWTATRSRSGCGCGKQAPCRRSRSPRTRRAGTRPARAPRASGRTSPSPSTRRSWSSRSPAFWRSEREGDPADRAPVVQVAEVEVEVTVGIRVLQVAEVADVGAQRHVVAQ